MAPPHTASDVLTSTDMIPRLAAFIAVVEAGGFTAASRQLRIDKTQLSRRVKALEQALEVRLLNRTTRSVHVTEAGRQLYDQTAGPLRDVLFSLRQAAQETTVEGVVRITSMPGHSESLWGPVLAELKRAHPDLVVHVQCEIAVKSLVASGLDMALRGGHLPDSSEIARRIATWRYIIVATPEWVQTHPEVQHPRDLVPHWLLYSPVRDETLWTFERGDEQVTIDVEPVVIADTHEIQRAAALQGLGVWPAGPSLCLDDLASRRLVRVLPEWRSVHTHGHFVITPHRSYTPRRVQAVIDAITPRLASQEARWREWSD